MVVLMLGPSAHCPLLCSLGSEDLVAAADIFIYPSLKWEIHEVIALHVFPYHFYAGKKKYFFVSCITGYSWPHLIAILTASNLEGYKRKGDTFTEERSANSY